MPIEEHIEDLCKAYGIELVNEDGIWKTLSAVLDELSVQFGEDKLC